MRFTISYTAHTPECSRLSYNVAREWACLASRPKALQALLNQQSLLGQLAEIKVFGVLPAHWPLILLASVSYIGNQSRSSTVYHSTSPCLDAGTVLVSVPPADPLLIGAGFVYCHCTGRRAVLGWTIHTVIIVAHSATQGRIYGSLCRVLKILLPTVGCWKLKNFYHGPYLNLRVTKALLKPHL